MEQASDEVLFEQYRTGDRGALRTLIERHQAELMRFLIRLAGDAAGAEDVFQETFLQIHLSADTFDPTRRFRPWLFTIAANKARDYLRRKGRRRMLELSAPVDNGSDDSGTSYVDLMEINLPGPDARLDAEETSRLVQEALDEMPPLLREILLLAYFQRLSYAQMHDELGIPLGTVKSRLHAAVAAFAKKWDALARARGSTEDHPRTPPHTP
ncbi:MAG: RNA polymerase sigma factor [Planctomycetota bacterium]|nr:RNA polymerase sigma factor [Planctomycetota bacterium]